MVKAIRHFASVMKVKLASTVDRPEICICPPGTDKNDAGTCRMGEDPMTSATNRYGQIHGITGLYIADNSLIPAFGPVNPTLTTAALAIRTQNLPGVNAKPIDRFPYEGRLVHLCTGCNQIAVDNDLLVYEMTACRFDLPGNSGIRS